MDYFGKIEQSLRFAWSYKKLWVLGFVASLGSGFNSFGNGSPGNSGSSFEDKEFDFFESTATILLICCIVIVAFIISLILWYLSQAANAGLIIASDKDDDNQEVPSLREAWKLGRAKAFSLMLLDLVIVLLVIALIIVCIPAFIFPPILCCLVFLFIPLVIFAGLVTLNAERVIVLENQGPIEAVKQSFTLVKANFVDLLVASLAYILVLIAWLILLVPLYIVAGVIALAVMAVGSKALVWLMCLSIFAIAFVIIMAVINSGFQVFTTSYFTKVYKAIRNQDKKTKE